MEAKRGRDELVSILQVDGKPRGHPLAMTTKGGGAPSICDLVGHLAKHLFLPHEIRRTTYLFLAKIWEARIERFAKFPNESTSDFEMMLAPLSATYLVEVGAYHYLRFTHCNLHQGPRANFMSQSKPIFGTIR